MSLFSISHTIPSELEILAAAAAEWTRLPTSTCSIPHYKHITMGGTILNDGRDHLYTVPPIRHLNYWPISQPLSKLEETMKVLSGSPMTNVTTMTPRLANISTGPLGRITKPSQVGLEPSPDAHTAMMTIMSTIAQKNSNCPLLGYFPPMGTWPMPTLPQPIPITPPRKACRCFNEGRCN